MLDKPYKEVVYSTYMSPQESEKATMFPNPKMRRDMLRILKTPEGPRRASFRAKLFESIDLLRIGKITPKDFLEGLMKEGDGRQVQTVVRIGGRIKAEEHDAYIGRTDDGKLVITMPSQYLLRAPTITVQVGLSEGEQLTAKAMKAESKKELGKEALKALINRVIIPNVLTESADG